MKLLITLLLITQTAWAGLPPTTVQGLINSSPQTKFNFQAPYQQMTDLGGVSALIETGNKNVLQNASFEDQGTTGFFHYWTRTLNSGADSNGIESTELHDGNHSDKETLTVAGTALISQYVTPKSHFSGTNLEASCWVNTALTDVQLCSGVAGSTQSNCVTVPGDSQWHQAIVNFSAGNGQSVGVVVQNQNSETGSWYTDDCYVGPARNLGTVAQAQWLGSIRTAETSGCNWVAPSTGAPANVTANASCPAPTVSTGSSITAPATKIPGFILPSKGAGLYKFVAKGSFYADVETCNARFSDGTNSSATMTYMFSGSAGEQGLTPTIEGEIYYATAPAANTTIQIQLAAVTTPGNCIIQLQGGANTAGLEISAYYYPPKSQIVQTTDQSDFGWTSQPGFTPSAGFGTIASPSYFWKRVGDMMFVKGTFTTGTTAASTASIALPSGYTIDSSKISSASSGTKVGLITNITASGTAQQIYSGGDAADLFYDGSTTGSVFAAFTVQSSAYVKVNGNGGFSSSGGISFEFSVPISQWVNTNRAPNLIGSVTSNSSSQSFHTEEATVNNASGTCLISSQSGSWISDSTASTGNCAFNMTGFSAPPACVSNTNLPLTQRITVNSATSVSITSYDNASTLTNSTYYVICMGPR